MTRRLCALTDLADGDAIGIDDPNDPWAPGTIVVRQGDRAFAYVNDCPHAHLPLDVIEGRFLTRERSALLCANHGARFRIEDGACLAGPCRGARLTPVPIVIEKGEIFRHGT